VAISGGASVLHNARDILPQLHVLAVAALDKSDKIEGKDDPTAAATPGILEE